ncbi:MAG: precorrin-3B C(17)-methyltransferase [Desulfosalsimonas sp.]|uniref:precorrin-3B C(17)-methyltransferase n=1 Tax=Desulfosalsimonas sp. TaxID=3073848 RepID=UPI003970F614
MSLRARQVIESVQVLCGYTTYMELVKPLITDQQVISTGMTREVDRVQQAVETVQAGRSCALICSGDPGIYAMAGLIFEVCIQNRVAVGTEPGQVSIEVVPGIPALSAGAALLGAPLMHDFCAISLSDLLTPWDLIDKRLHAAGAADFVTVLYNPRSKKRNWQLDSAKQILLQHRRGNTPVGLVTSAMRDDQNIVLTTLADLDCTQAGMQTTIFVGNSHTFVSGARMITPRGYGAKYQLQFDAAGQK